VNNAGITGANGTAEETTEADWDRVMATNAKGVFFCTKHAVPLMRRAGGGSIVNLSSVYGIVGSHNVAAYHASKGAIRIMSKTDALAFAEDRIRVNSVHPGFIWTPMLEAGAQVPGVAPRRCMPPWPSCTRSARWANRTTSPTASSTSPPTKPSSSPAASW
jgi:NAD(P)-dependent dehydrogenase (short-subunit alcohol dehydrogenase family)